LLVVEVADSSLRFDRRRKLSLYARGGIEDYWIVNLIDRLLEVYRAPAPDPAGFYGWSYGTVEQYARQGTVTLLALPVVRIPVSDLVS
jgi:Uma2 family endonuclease